MSIEKNVSITLTPKEVAQQIWSMWGDEQVDMFAELLNLAGSEHDLMMQFLHVRDRCEEEAKKGKPESLAAFQVMFSSAYKYMIWEN